ncbi:MAG: integrase family protein [Geobacteraceae bacterium]|nr:integrase family protein [Geobacteraceae bacterium]
MRKQKLTKSVIDRLPYADDGKRYEAWDTELKGYAVRVSATEKTFVVFKRIGGKLTRVTLGKHGVLTADEARKKAIKVLAELGDGIDVNAEKARARVRGKTVQEVLDDYTATKQLKPNTILDYGKVLRLYASDWLNKPIAEITSEMIAARHLKTAKETGSVPANKLGRYLRLLFNFAMAKKYTELPENPVRILSTTGQWRKETRRQKILQPAELPQWFDAVMGLEQPITRTSMLLMLFTGLRKVEALSLRWEDVDLENEVFTVPAEVTKNKRALALPMSDYTKGLFEKALMWRENDFVFPGDGKTEHLTETRRQIEAVERKTGLKIGNHDLRRTFITIAESEVSYSVLKRLVNHSSASDVTQGYIVIDVERLRGPIQGVTDALMLATHAWCPYNPALTQQEANLEEKIISLDERRKRKVT